MTTDASTKKNEKMSKLIQSLNAASDEFMDKFERATKETVEESMVAYKDCMNSLLVRIKEMQRPDLTTLETLELEDLIDEIDDQLRETIVQEGKMSAKHSRMYHLLHDWRESK